MKKSIEEYMRKTNKQIEDSKKTQEELRLDKVLAKFEKIEEGYYEYQIKTQTSNKIKYTVVTIVYLDNQFQFDNAKDRPIKLNTVESLIKDMEES
jgi:predicted transcriptional regulator